MGKYLLAISAAFLIVGATALFTARSLLSRNSTSLQIQRQRDAGFDADRIQLMSSSNDDRDVEVNISQHDGTEDAVLEKKVFSDKMRVIFLVGLEGTGHHYLSSVLTALCDEDVICVDVCKVGRATYPGLSIPDGPNFYQRARSEMRTELENLATKEQELGEEHAAIGSFGACHDVTGMMSYPNFNGKHKTLQYVDIKILAEEAENAGIDLRIVYLARPALDVLISDTGHNKYGQNFMLESRILIASAAIVDSLLGEVDPRFLSCFYYDSMSDTAQADRVSKFLSPSDVIAKHMSNSLVSTARPSTKIPGQSVDERARNEWGASAESHMLVASRLQEKLDVIEQRFC